MFKLLEEVKSIKALRASVGDVKDRMWEHDARLRDMERQVRELCDERDRTMARERITMDKVRGEVATAKQDVIRRTDKLALAAGLVYEPTHEVEGTYERVS